MTAIRLKGRLDQELWRPHRLLAHRTDVKTPDAGSSWHAEVVQQRILMRH